MSVHPRRRARAGSAKLVPSRRVATSLWRMYVDVCCEMELSRLALIIHRGVAASRLFSCQATVHAITGIHRRSAIPENGNAPAKSQRSAWLPDFQGVCRVTMLHQM